MSKFIEKIVLAIMQDSQGTVNVQKIYSQLPVKSKIQKQEIFDALRNLEKIGKITEKSKNQWVYESPKEVLEGRLEINRRGVGFVIPANDELNGNDVQIDAKHLINYLPDDVVQVEYKKRGSKFVGTSIKLVKRSDKVWVGTLDVFENIAYLIVDNNQLAKDIIIRKGIKPEMHQMKAAARIIKFDDSKRNPVGELIEILGKEGSNDAEMHAIVAEFGFRTQFPAEVEQQANAYTNTINNDEIKRRKDMRKTLTFTIDPFDAKDFDDAISFKALPNGNFEIGVHIADVSHYVLPNTALDDEAFKRATSVYLADRTIPMLPEHLSNNLCSLRPNEDRLAFSAIFELDSNSKVLNEWFGKTIIHSQRRFTYEEAQERIETKTGDLQHEINLCNQLSKNLQQQRFNNGAIAFESAEIRFKIDENGKPIELIKKERFDAHKLIEEFMLLANRKVAKFVKTLKKPEPPFIYRTHDNPPFEKLMELMRFCQIWGYKIDISTEESMRKSINKLIADTTGKPEAHLLQSQAIRSMAKAVYTGKKSEHFGLAFKYYTHFTSPIRRYPDLLVHRMLQHYLLKQPVEYTAAQIEHIAEHSSNMEQKAAEAERASTKYKMAEYMEQFVGSVFTATVSGLTEWGMYAEINDNYCEGMIRLSDIKTDQFAYFEKEKKVIGRRTKREFGMGDTISIRVKKADKNTRQIDFTLAD